MVKKIISFLLKKVPRKYLQRVSHYVLKAATIFYRGNNVECPVCGMHFRKFLPYGRVARSNALCPNCLSLERHRLIWLYLEKKTDFFSKPAKMLHVAPEHCFISRFEALEHLEYITGDIESPLAKIKMDVHDIPFEDAVFDIVFCNHVLEHVEDDRKAMSEIFRVMKKGGWGILQIPLFFPLPEKTIEDPTIKDPKKREELFGQDDHVRKYGPDYKDRLAEAGFNVYDGFNNELTEEEIHRYSIVRNDTLYVVGKN